MGWGGVGNRALSYLKIVCETCQARDFVRKERGVGYDVHG